MICTDSLPVIFAETLLPAGPITDQAADTIARLLWAVGASEHQEPAVVGTDEGGSDVSTQNHSA